VADELQRLGRVPMTLYQTQVTVRQTRNDWVHTLAQVGRESAQTAVELLVEMLALTSGVRLRVPPIAHLHG
jgi:hypothetical protein